MILAAHASTRSVAVTAGALFRATDGGWHMGRIALQALAPASRAKPPGLAFALSLVQPLDPALQPLEATAARFRAGARRNAESLGAAAAAARLNAPRPVAEPRQELHHLTERELEIVRRLVAAQRVPAIARELFLSQSTVRNHLTAVYRKFGVHSQVELLELLRPS
jgi:DNA-binding CsgD family transcriptional regulator